MKKNLRFTALLLCLLTVLGGVASTAAAYSTYTYDIDGFAVYSPDAYSVYKVMTLADMKFKIADDEPGIKENPTDMFIDDQGEMYLADPTGNRIAILDKYNTFKFYITSFVNNLGVSDSLSGPQGVFVKPTEPGGNRRIFVADTGNHRIVEFDYDGTKVTYRQHFEAPSSDVFEENTIYNPVAIAVDSSDRMYVVNSQAYEGILSLNADGSFAQFIGATKVAGSALSRIWRMFQTAAQREQQADALSVEYNNITIDAEGFIYATTAGLPEGQVLDAIRQKSKSGDYAPVKRMNAAGNDIMRRNGFFPPSGEVDVNTRFTTSTYSDAPSGASTIVDVAMGPEQTWTILDQKRGRSYTYDYNGNLLFAFGDKGSQKGNLRRATAVAYRGDELLIMDGETRTISVYHRTQYGDILIDALASTNRREYDKAAENWQSILQRNNNFDAAYVGIGDSLYREGKWQEAMEMYKMASDIDSYSSSFREYRKDLVSKWIMLVIAVIIVFIILLVIFFKFAGKVNKKTALKVGKKTFWEEVIYAFHVMMHPFDGFWDLKHEKRGSVRGALFWLLFCILAFSYNGIGTAYLFNPYGGIESIFAQVSGILLPLLLYCAANWCLTTLFDGEGSFKDIFVALCYATVPLSFMIIFGTVLTNFLTLSEAGFVSLVTGLGWVWFALLLFFGTMVTHDYSLGKNILTLLGTVIGIALILFLIILFAGLMFKMVSFVSNVITEITYRA